jgi:23S rRNA (guanosine2251-2'-O)-methyltransferase
MKIIGQHAIYAAHNNKKRNSNQVFYGTKDIYNKLNLRCQFQQSEFEYLLVSEVYVKTSFEDILESERIILVDGIFDPRNLGSIIRTAAALGFNVITRKSKGCVVNDTVIKCASGGIENIELYECTNLVENIKKMKKNDFWLVGLHETGKDNINFITSNEKFKKIVLVIGSENTGISAQLLKDLDFIISIPTTEFSTLNASVAAALGMFLFNNA